MKAGRKIAVFLSFLAICWFASGSLIALGQDETPETEEPKKEAEEKEKEEEEEVPPEGPNESITVTATRVETDLMKTPVAVSVFDQETLDREGIRNVRDLAQLVPNMDISTNNGQSTPVISLRGVRSTNETELGDPAVGVHLDGIYSPRMQGILAMMFDNERVEVLRGPQGTLFGRNSTVGSINIITAKPKFDRFSASLFFQYANFDAPELQAVVNVPVSDTFALRFSGRYFQRDSYIDGYWDPNQYDQRYIADRIGDPAVIAPTSEDCTGPQCHTRTQHSNWWTDEADGGYPIYELVPADNDDFYLNAKEWAYRVSGRWQPRSGQMSLNLLFQHYQSDSAGGIDLVNCDKLRGRPTYEFDDEFNIIGVSGTNDCSDLFPEDDTYQAVVNTPGRFYLDIKYFRSQYELDLGRDLRFVYSLGIEDQERESAQDMEQSLNAWDQALFFLPGTGSQSWMQELQFQSYGAKKFNWIAGANFFNEKTATIGFFDNPLDPKSFWDQPERSTIAWALFGQGTYSFSPKWYLTFGYRHSDETKQDEGGRTFECTVGNGCAPELDRQQIDQITAFGRESLSRLSKDYFANPDNYPEDAVSPNDNKGSWSHDDWRIGLDYDMNPNTLLYTYLATGFKSGGIGDVFTLNDARPPAPGEEKEQEVVRTSFGPEEVTTLELGVKTRLFDRKLDLRGAYFFSDYENMQYASVGAIGYNIIWGPYIDPETGDRICCDFVPSPLIAYYTQNVPGAQIQGIELEYDSRPWRGGGIHGYVSWLDTEITEDWITKWNYDPVSYFGLSYADSIDPTNEELQVNLKGNELAVSAPFKFRMTVDHAFLLSKRGITFVPWLTAYWEDRSYLTIWNVDKHTSGGQPCPEQGPDETPDGCLNFVILDEDIKYTDDRREAWSMFHAGLRFYMGDWMAELFAYNITDEAIQYWGGAAEQVAKGSFSTPRTYGFRVQYNF